MGGGATGYKLGEGNRGARFLSWSINRSRDVPRGWPVSFGSPSSPAPEASVLGDKIRRQSLRASSGWSALKYLTPRPVTSRA